jgi:hypothetical protein
VDKIKKILFLFSLFLLFGCFSKTTYIGIMRYGGSSIRKKIYFEDIKNKHRYIIYFKKNGHLTNYIKGIDKYMYRKVCIYGIYKKLRLLLANGKEIFEESILLDSLDDIMLCGGIK